MQEMVRSMPVVPHQPRALRTREALLGAVEALVASEGPAAVTTTRLAAETGVSVGTIYRYFSDREALLLAAYDATVARIVEQCAATFGTLPADMAGADAARFLLSRYLDAAEAIPAHAGLLSVMRTIRPIEADQQGENQAGIIGDLILPFLARYAPGAEAFDPVRLQFMSVLIGTMIDLYLVTGDAAARARLREEIEAHVALMVERLSDLPDTVRG
jgi:AcrR family transcriptional regulator